ncbi:DUF4062 domain-containing protein [Lysobacter sp. H23M47]|uniref:DUF4062 domain-containing protein n=1 Tax=Lysobacter sp. H23M47 TaxID=2781024 RepID=UPI0018824193|nr:DUF4062 domain-containing protein [Lysobacter sp. H23M47]QOW24821.1 DUF4062 domain-containing protein [Lysobacter sp. H23M47]
MSNSLPTHASAPDRLEVFISSTIGECETERASARRAIRSLNFVPIQFEREGARAEAPRDFYLRKLYGSHFVIGIYRNSYGWIDEAKGMLVSGLEDEFRETTRLGKDLLAYVLKTAPDRDARLSTMLEELKAGPYTVYFFEDGEDLESRIRDDLTAVVSDRVVRSQHLGSSSSSASGILRSIFRGSPFRLRRTALLESLSHVVASTRAVWMTGAPGAGKTALAAEWADENGAPYINARGLDPRSILVEAARSLGIADGIELAVPIFEDARELLVSRWQHGRNWPLVIDDPDDIEAIWPVLSECLIGSSIGSVIVVARQVPTSLPGTYFEVSGFSAEELVSLRGIAGAAVPDLSTGELPLALRSAGGGNTLLERFESLETPLREVLGYLALSPAPLELEDLISLLGSAAPSPADLTDKLDSLADLLMDSQIGFSFIHDLYRDRIIEVLSARRQLRALLTNRLAERLARTGRAWAAFSLRRDEANERAEKLANLAIREAVFSGSIRHLVDALEHLSSYYRSRGEKGPLISVLMSLADARTSQGRPGEAPVLVDEAITVAKEIGDDEAQRTLEILQASIALRQSTSRGAIERVRELRQAAETEGRHADIGRLLLEEGTALLGANEPELAAPLYRQAREIFSSIDDEHGLEVSTRNLVAALASVPGGVAESDRLRAELSQGEAQSPRYRAWLCNLLVPRLRRNKRFAEAEAMAREAISIGESLDDQYVVAINLIVLGNVLRDDGKIGEAIEAYTRAGRTAHMIARPDIDGRSSRLLALTENEIAKAASGSVRREHAERAELYASHAAGIYSDSFGWSEYAYAVEERGDARGLLGRDEEALADYADAVAAYLRAEDDQEAERLLRYLTGLVEDRSDASSIIARAFGSTASADSGQSSVWVAALTSTLDKCPRSMAPRVLGVLVRGFYPGEDGSWWFDCLVRCLLHATRERAHGNRDGMGSFLLLAILAFSRHRDFSFHQLLILAGLCIGENDKTVVRHQPGQDLIQIVRVGKDQRALFTVRDEGKSAEATFVSLILGSFLDAFGLDVAAILFGDDTTSAIALDVVIFAQAEESTQMAEFISEGLKDKPVATARIDPNPGEEVPIVMFVRKDAMRALKATSDRGGELEIMLARFLDSVLHTTVGASIDDDIYRSKIKDVLLRVLG